MVGLRPHREGTILPVRAQPGARKSLVRGEHNGMLKVSVTTAPEKGKANEAIAKVLCSELGLAASQVELIAGPTTRDKQFLVRGLSAEELQSRVTVVLERVAGQS